MDGPDEICTAFGFGVKGKIIPKVIDKSRYVLTSHSTCRFILTYLHLKVFCFHSPILLSHLKYRAVFAS